MSEPNAVQNVAGVEVQGDSDDVARVDDLTRAWDSSPLTDPVQAQDPDARPIEDHGDTDVESERTAKRPDF